MSGEKVPYHLRQNKFIERELFIDLLGQVDRRNPISEYLYVGFGGAYLEDFKILHSAFGNKSMLSLEQLPWIHERQQFNLPYGCVTCTNKTSGDFIDEFADILNEFKTPPLLVWLDYADTDWRSQLNEYVALSSKLRKGDILKITLNVNPATLGGRDLAENDDEDALAENLRQKRLETVTEKLGEFLPNEATQSDLQTKRFPALMLKALRAAAFRGLSGSIGMDLHPISAVTYSDTHKMLTVTAIMLEKNEVQEFLITTGLKTHDFTT